MPMFGYHAVYESDFTSALEAAAEYGFHYVQFDLNVPDFYIDELTSKQLDNIRAMSLDLGVGISFHAPGDSVGLFTDYPLIRKGLLDHLKLVLRQANHLGAHHLTVHPLDPPFFRRADSLEDSFRAEHHDYFSGVLKENLTQLIGAAAEVPIVVENCHLGGTARNALAELILEGTEVFLALDWAKMHKKGRVLDEDQDSFYAQHRHRIRELHLHDADGQGRSHLAPGQGNLDFSPLFSRFYDKSQWLTVEVRPVSEAVRARAIFSRMCSGVNDGIDCNEARAQSP